MNKFIFVFFIVFAAHAQASKFVNTEVLKDAAGNKKVTVKTRTIGNIESSVLSFEVKVLALSPELKGKYLIMSLGKIPAKETHGTNCVASQVYQTNIAPYTTPVVAISVVGPNCAGVVERFLNEDFEVIYQSVKTGVGEDLSPVRLSLKQE